MLRNGATRLAWRSATAPVARPAASLPRTVSPLQRTTQFGSMASISPRPAHMNRLKPVQAAMLRRGISEKIPETQKQAENKYAHESIKPTPETVSSTSSTHPIFSEIGTENPQREVDMMAGVKHDVVRKLAYCRSHIISYWIIANLSRAQFVKPSIYPRCLEKPTTWVSLEHYPTSALPYLLYTSLGKSTMPTLATDISCLKRTLHTYYTYSNRCK